MITTMPESIGANKIKWRLEAWLASQNTNRHQLAEIMEGENKSNLTTLYRIQKATRMDLPTLTRIIEGCKKLTGKKPSICDLLEYDDTSSN
jgi:DNA-binding Xre family transcriptional regulator